MRPAWFSEVQRMRDNSWILLLVLVLMIGPMIPLYYGFFQQIIVGAQWGDKPMSNSGLIFFTMFITLCIAFAAFSVTSLTLETKIDSEGIHYRMYPFWWRWRVLTPPEIDRYTIEEKFGFFEGKGLGHHRNVFKKLRSFKMYGGKHLSLHLKNGHRLLLGTANREGMEMAMRKLFNQERF